MVLALRTWNGGLKNSFIPGELSPPTQQCVCVCVCVLQVCTLHVYPVSFTSCLDLYYTVRLLGVHLTTIPCVVPTRPMV